MGGNNEEGFTIRTLNTTSYAPDEIYLVAPNVQSFNLYAPANQLDYSKGYTHTEAQAACAKFKGRLAPLGLSPKGDTTLTLNKALDLSANWCAAGWTEGDTTNAYFPKALRTACNPTAALDTRFNIPVLTSGIGKYTPTDGKAYAVCIGPKPPQPTVNVNDFNQDSYSMFSDAIINSIIDTAAAPSDIFPVVFQPAQAYYALSQTAYNPTNARKWLINNYETSLAATNGSDPLNAALYTPEATTDSTAWNSGASTQSCVSLKGAHDTLKGQVAAIQNLFRDLSANVISITEAKVEGTSLQSRIAAICNTNSTAACQRLVSLDMDTFYLNRSVDGLTQKTMITDLENLNFALSMVECQFQESLGNLQIIMSILGCSGYDINTLRDNTLTDFTGKVTPIKCDKAFTKGVPTDLDPTITNDGTAPKTAFKIGKDIDYNSVELVKLSLQQIAPFYNADNYKVLVQNVLNQLSVMLRTPFVSDYIDSQTMFQDVGKERGIIDAILKMV